jgi:hypothetical protein
MEEAELTEATRLVSEFSRNLPKSHFSQIHQPVIGQQMPTVPVVTFADAFASDPPPIVTMLEIERAKKLCPS